MIHNPESILFSWAQDESEGEAIIAESMTVQAIVDSLKYHYENRQTDTLRIMQWKNKSSIKEKVSIASSDGKHVEFNVEVMWVSYDGTDITDTTEFVPFRHTQDFIKFKLTDYSLIIKDEQGNCLHLETYFKNNIINLIEYIGITRTMLGLECKDNDGNIDIACTILNLIKDGIAQEDTIFTLPYQYCSTGSHTTKITHNDKTFSVHVVPGLCTSSSNRKFSLQEKDKRTIGSKEAFVFMRSDVHSLDGATTVRVEKKYVDDLESYLFGDDIKVHCKADVNCNEISNISKNILREVAKGFDTPEVLISSGRRSVEDQVAAMFYNCENGGVEAQYKLYGTNGRAVVEVFEDTFNGDNETETKQAMIDKINELGGYNVSRHCGSIEEYNNYNVIDLSIRTLSSHNVDIDKFVEALDSNDKIAKVIDERDNGINCIHVEIKIN